MNSVHSAKENFMSINYHPKPQGDGFIGKPSDESITEEVVREIMNSENGYCYSDLKRNYGSWIANWIPKLMNNDYKGLKEADHINQNFDSIEDLGVTFKSKKCGCGTTRECKKLYSLDRKVDPHFDQGVPAHQVIFHMPTWEMTQKEFKASLHSFFNDPTNILAREIDRFIEEERLEEMGVDPELYLDASDYEEEYE